jgi:hypothetical protein
VTNIVILNSQTHRTLRVQGQASALHGDKQRFVPVIISEFPLLAVHCPILLSKDAETGVFYCGAMLGFDERENLFLGEGSRYEAYRPLNLQRGPFFTAGNDLAIDLDSSRIDAAGAEPLFNESGAPTPYLESIMALMRELRPGLERTKIFVETLMKLKLVVALSINVGFDDGTQRDVTGLYTIDKEVLKGLDDATVLDLFRRGYLHLIYLLIASVNQVAVLAQKKNQQFLQSTGVLGRSVG